MFNLIGGNKRIIQVVIALIAVPFVFFGVDSYFGLSGGSQSVARVGDYKISQPEFVDALRERQESLRRMTQGKLDAALLDSPELRYATLDNLIQRRLLLDRAIRSGMTVSDQQLQKVVAEQPGFKDESNQFSYERYQQVLRSEGMTPAGFEARLRRDLILEQQREGYFGSGFVSKTVLDRLVRLAEQQREVSYYRITPDRFAGQVSIGPEAVKQYYEANQREFQIPERVKVDFIVLSVEALAAQIQLEPAELKTFYESRRSQYQTPEARRASHILIGVDASAGADARKNAKARAEEIYKELAEKPGSFAELAKKYSQDPGSAANGGDLGFVSLGNMKDVPEFEAALFKLKEGETSQPVATKHGFHIIRLTTLRPGQGKSFEEVRGQIEEELRKQRAGQRFAELADRFNNTVYEQSESLKVAAELVKKDVQRSGWITRTSADPAVLNHPRLLEAVFSQDVLKDRRNSEAIEVAPRTLVAVRLVEHSPSSNRPFTEVRADIEKLLQQRAAARLAVEAGRGELEQLEQGKSVTVAWSKPELIKRAEHKGLSEAMVRQAFRVDTAKLPAYVGVENPEGGYTLLRVSRVVPGEDIAPEKRRGFSEALRQVLGQQELAAYLASVRQKTEIQINKERLERR
jgi:peptidyl-prolyl cis-trans isomerase D